MKHYQFEIINSMKLSLVFLILFSFFCCSNGKMQQKVINAVKFAKNHTTYLSKLDVGKGEGFFKVKTKRDIDKNLDDRSNIKLRIGLLKDANYDQFMELSSCTQKEKLYFDSRQVIFEESSSAQIIFNVVEIEKENIWYLYAYDCESKAEQYVNLPFKKLIFELSLKNNGSWFGENQNLIPQYLFVTLLWIALTIRYSIQILKSIKQTKYWSKVIIYIGFFVLFLSYFYRLLNLLVVSMNGTSLVLLDTLADIIKHLIEGIFVGVMMSIACGWSIVTLHPDRSSLFLGFYMTVLNIICAVMDNQDAADMHHHYDKITVPVILSLRGGLLFFFLYMARQTIVKSKGKIKLFMKKFALWGTVYLLGWPIGFAICQLFLPNYMHRQIMVLVEQSAHVLGNGFMCYSFVIATSQYRQIDKQNQVFLPD